MDSVDTETAVEAATEVTYLEQYQPVFVAELLDLCDQL